MEFNELKLHPDLQRGIAEAGYTNCMPVQEQVLGHAFFGQDMYVQSQTGTGKTAAFLVVIFQRLLTEPLLTGKKAIIMVPTRELAVQVEDEARKLGKYLPFKVGSFYGGVGYTQQLKLLRENAQIMVGTPGRVLDLNQSGQMNLMDIAFLILDEADRMFDMGFYPDLRKLIKAVPPADRRQTMLFSATLNAWVKNLAWEYTKSPYEIEIEPETVVVNEVEEILYHVPSEHKMRLLLGILKRENPESVVVFCNTKRYTEIISKRLRMNGYDAEFIIGDLPQPKRLKVIDDIKKGKLRCLVATDVAARGLDIEDLSLVVNYDLPNEAENYVHRIGRTARAGKTGKAITLASEQDVYELPAIERYIGKKIPAETAVEELYAEDSSEGSRVQTEFTGERSRGPRDSRKRGAGDENRPRDRNRKPEARGGPRPKGPAERGPSTAEKPGQKRQAQKPTPEQKSRSGPVRNAAQAAPSRNRAGEDPNLNGLSFEERMTYYKQKYQRGPGKETRKPGPKSGREQPIKRTASEAPPPDKTGGAEKKQGFLAKLLGKLRKKPGN